MTDAQKEQELRAEKLLAETRADLLKRQLSNSENYDRAILSLSTVFLGFSFAFLKDFVPADQVRLLWLLYGSWAVLTGAVLVTIASFLVSQRAITVQLKRAEEYYLYGNQKAVKKSLIARWTDWLNIASGIFFAFGILLTTAFVISNFERSSSMSNEKKSSRVLLNEGAPIPKLQEIPFERGAPIPNLQQAPQTQSSQTQQSNEPAAKSTENGGTESVESKK